jgi:hypothetical protein
VLLGNNQPRTNGFRDVQLNDVSSERNLPRVLTFARNVFAAMLFIGLKARVDHILAEQKFFCDCDFIQEQRGSNCIERDGKWVAGLTYGSPPLFPTGDKTACPRRSYFFGQ